MEDNNNPSDEATKEKVLPDYATYDKSNQKTNQGKDALQQQIQRLKKIFIKM